VAIAELAEAADGRADLLAKCAGLALGYGERQPEATHYQRMAELCIAAGADKTLIQRWIDVGRQRADTTTRRSHTPGFPLTASEAVTIMLTLPSPRASFGAPPSRRGRRAAVSATAAHRGHGADDAVDLVKVDVEQLRADAVERDAPSGAVAAQSLDGQARVRGALGERDAADGRALFRRHG
jgi:hypothetical protein